ncbi:homeobox protein Hox-A4a-like [Silurus meridionalis]|uniref:homeobox protein Hox-A4a-like n=1 Tax=Silurus meridionalis TaxID=175797 RepID=UPI001EEB39D7|nr:homeobox protein Hox-A4a-like [Silurus meridionalis]
MKHFLSKFLASWQPVYSNPASTARLFSLTSSPSATPGWTVKDLSLKIMVQTESGVARRTSILRLGKKIHFNRRLTRLMRVEIFHALCMIERHIKMCFQISLMTIRQ